LYQSRVESIVGKELFDKYFWTQKQHCGFFKMVEYCALNTFIVKVLHGFDNNRQALTLRDIDKYAYVKFLDKEENKRVLEKVKKLRNKVIAHFDKKQPIEKKLPSFEKIDLFFINLQNFYNNISKKIERSTTFFEQDKDFRREIEKVLQNLYIGEKNRLLGIESKWDWEKNPKKISAK